MKHAEQTPKSPAAKTGFFATLSNLLPAKGTGAPSRRSSGRVLAAAFLAAACLLALTASSASAAILHPYQ